MGRKEGQVDRWRRVSISESCAKMRWESKAGNELGGVDNGVRCGKLSRGGGGPSRAHDYSINYNTEGIRIEDLSGGATDIQYSRVLEHLLGGEELLVFAFFLFFWAIAMDPGDVVGVKEMEDVSTEGERGSRLGRYMSCRLQLPT